MRFTLTVRLPGGGGGHEEHDIISLAGYLRTLAGMLNVLAVGETVEIRRIS